MKALRSFTVRPSLPAELSALAELAFNLRWSWDDQTRDLFRWVDPDLWDASVHDPVRLLGLVSRERLDALARDAGFRRFLGEVRSELQRYLDGERWFQAKGSSPLGLVAYFSPEFGIAEAVPQYSGGLGVLAGDHLKSSSDLGVPLVGVGLLYRHGYFRQSLDADGWQQERYPLLDPHVMALTLCEDVRVEVDLAADEMPLVAQLWKAEVGRVPLYFLDADVEENSDEIRSVTDRLYGGDTEHRLRQEILLGIGGVRALQAIGIDAQVFHTNEGHAGFLGLERIRQLVADERLSYTEAIEAVRAGCIFTTHTPVPAGIDRFPLELMDKYFSRWCDEVGVKIGDLVALGHRPRDEPDEPFNMAVMGLRLAGRSNGVAQLHGEVSREMFGDLWPDLEPDETPIAAITNGVHAHTWTSPEIADVLSRYVLPDWDEAGPDLWARISEVPDDELWRAHEQARERMVTFVRRRLKEAAAARGLTGSDVAWTDEVLDPRVLTIGFARRFATYKRATLLLSQPDRLRELLLSPDRPMQLVFAGKAHPADEQGKEMIRQIVAFSSDPAIRHRIVFVDDYDISVARALYQGSDVWLNNPRRPQEACGTSGMKAALNGGLNLSILDGWWHEMFNGENGWAISSAEDVEDLEPARPTRGGRALRPARAPGRAAVLRALRRPGPPAVVEEGPQVARIPRTSGDRIADGGRLCRGAVRADRGPHRPAVRRRPCQGPGARRLEGPGPGRLARRTRRPCRGRHDKRRPGQLAHGRGRGRTRHPVARRRRRRAGPRPRGAGRRVDRALDRLDDAGRDGRRPPRPLRRLAADRAGRALRVDGADRPTHTPTW